jgi:hypothetical protein
MVPLPLPVLTVIVQEVPEPDTLPTLAPLRPVVFNVKSLADRPATEAAKVAVYCTEAALVSVLLTAVNELMVVLGADTVLDGIATFTVVALLLDNERFCPE